MRVGPVPAATPVLARGFWDASLLPASSTRVAVGSAFQQVSQVLIPSDRKRVSGHLLTTNVAACFSDWLCNKFTENSAVV